MLKALTRTSMLLAAIISVSALTSGSAPAAERCNTAKQCHGLLPQICMRCSNGHEACAHWACVRHRCVVETCPRKYEG